jgi:hypothetical protein
VIQKGTGETAQGTEATFVAVLVLEAAIIIALWFFQRAFA